MKRLILLSLFLITFIIIGRSNAQAENSEIGKLIINPYFTYTTASAFFDINGKQKAAVKVFREGEGIKDSVDQNYEYRKYTFGIRADYLLSEQFMLFAEMPFSFHTLSESQTYHYFFDSVNYTRVREVLPSHSTNRLDYLAIGGKYFLANSQTFISQLILEGRIPSGFQKGIYSDTTQFLSDGAFECLAGGVIGLNFRTLSFRASALYNWRDEELEPRMLIDAKIGLRTVPGSELSVNLNIAQSLTSFDGARPFNPRETISQENYINLGFGFWFLITKDIFFETSYQVTIDGRNTHSLGEFRISAGTAFQLFNK